jgi:acyl-ACP thioesterase
MVLDHCRCLLHRWVYHRHNLEAIGLGLVKWRKTFCCVNDNTEEAEILRDKGDSVSFHP